MLSRLKPIDLMGCSASKTLLSAELRILDALEKQNRLLEAQLEQRVTYSSANARAAGSVGGSAAGTVPVLRNCDDCPHPPAVLEQSSLVPPTEAPPLPSRESTTVTNDAATVCSGLEGLRELSSPSPHTLPTLATSGGRPGVQGTAQHPAHPTDNDMQFSMLGVRMQGFFDFIEECGGEGKLLGLSTTEVCEKFVRPRCGGPGGKSYCLLLKERESTVVETANVFVSHAWQVTFLEVVSALKDYVESCCPGAVLWFDLFSNNQIAAPSRKFEWWTTTFRTAIKSFGHTVLVLSPWDNPIPLTRAWCLFEIYTSIVTQCKFDIAMSQKESTVCWQLVRDDLGQYNKMIAAIDVKRSQAGQEDDRQRIFEAIQADGPNSFDRVNQLVLERIRKWVIDTAQSSTMSASHSRDSIDDLESQSALASLLQMQNRLFEAETIFRACVEKRMATVGPRSASTLTSMNQLAINLQYQRRFSEALDLLYEVLAVREELYGRADVITLGTLHNIATSCMQIGQVEKALALFRECLQGYQVELGPSNYFTVACQFNLSTVLCQSGRFNESLPLLLQAFDLFQRIRGHDHPETLTCMHTLAAVYKDLQRYADAESKYRLCIRRRAARLGEAHADTVLSQIGLANVLQLMGTPGSRAEARKLYESFLASWDGENYKMFLAVSKNLASILASSGESDAALTILEEALHRTKSLAKESDIEALQCRGDVAIIALAQGRLPTAADAASACLELCTRHLGSSCVVTLGVQNTLGEVLCRQRRYSEATAVLEQCLRFATDSSSPSSGLLSARVMHNLGNAYLCSSIFADASAMFRKSWETRKEALGPSNLDTLASLQGYTSSLRLLGNLDEAMQMAQSHLELARGLPVGFGSATLIAGLKLSALCAKDKQQIQLSHQLFDEMHQIATANLGESSASAIDALYNLSTLKMMMGKLKEAELGLVQCLQHCPPSHTDETRYLASIALADALSSQGIFEESRRAVSELLDAITATNPSDQRIPSIIMCLSRSLCGSGDFALAERAFEKYFESVRGCDEIRGVDFFSMLRGRAHVLVKWGKYQAAETMLLDCLEKQKAEARIDDKEVASTMLELSKLFLLEGRYSDAEAYLPHEKFGSSGRAAVVAQLRFKQGRLSEARNLFEEQLAETTAACRGDTAASLQIKCSIAMTRLQQGEVKPAAKLIEDVAESAKSLLGGDHPTTLAIMSNCASILDLQGRGTEAVDTWLQVMDARLSLLGPDHPDTLSVQDSLGVAYLNQGHIASAEKIIMDVFERRKRVLGEGHPDTLRSEYFVAELLRYQQRLPEAEALLTSNIARRSSILGPSHPDTLQSTCRRAMVQILLGGFPAAESALLDCLVQQKDTLGWDHPDTLFTRRNLASMHLSAGAREKAEALMKDCIATATDAFGEQSAYVVALQQGYFQKLASWSSLIDSRG